jgi:hypothetical protein
VQKRAADRRIRDAHLRIEIAVSLFPGELELVCRATNIFAIARDVECAGPDTLDGPVGGSDAFGNKFERKKGFLAVGQDGVWRLSKVLQAVSLSPCSWSRSSSATP